VSAAARAHGVDRTRRSGIVTLTDGGARPTSSAVVVDASLACAYGLRWRAQMQIGILVEDDAEDEMVA
jgi:hypothetical protein